MLKKKEIMIVDEISLKEKIYLIRGQQVMLDFELAEMYGYTTKRFNEQVKNNIEKFDSDFMFQLTRDEVDSLVRSKFSTSLKNDFFRGQAGGSRYLPHAFTEQGIYMLMTVLRGELATKQSKTLIRLFKRMKDYLVENQPLITGYAALVKKVEQHTDDIKALNDNTVKKSELSEFMKLFSEGINSEEVLILDGQPFKADIAYQKICKKAKKNLILVDEYLSIKTLHHLVHTKRNVKIIIISDNKGKNPLRLAEYEDFVAEYPDTSIKFIKSSGKVHDRYIVLDHGTKNMMVFHSGASVKDAGKKITTISQLTDISEYSGIIKKLLSNQKLILR